MYRNRFLQVLQILNCKYQILGTWNRDLVRKSDWRDLSDLHASFAFLCTFWIQSENHLHIPLHLSDLKNSANFRHEFCQFVHNFPNTITNNLQFLNSSRILLKLHQMFSARRFGKGNPMKSVRQQWPAAHGTYHFRCYSRAFCNKMAASGNVQPVVTPPRL